MSIATALTALADDISAARAKITSKGGTVTPNGGTSQLVDDIDTIPTGGITPTGNINITDTNVTDVTNYATAQVVDADLVASNIKKDVNILGVVGTFEGGGGSLPSVISKNDGGSFTLASDTLIGNYDIHHNLGEPPIGFAIWSDNVGGSYGVYTVKNASSIASNMAAYAYFTNDTTERPLANGTWSGTATTFKVTRANINYKAGITYKWLAWA